MSGIVFLPPNPATRPQNDVAVQVASAEGKTRLNAPWRADMFRSLTGALTVNSPDLRLYQYRLIGDVLELWVRVAAATTGSGMGAVFRMQLPEGYRAQEADLLVGYGRFNDGTTNADLQVFTVADPLAFELSIIRDSAAAFTSSITHGIILDVVARVPVRARVL